ncbi:hypothetical protein EPN83_01735 [Patescibacteria group bacterium]|nr:MAG: hypothetical protein EPN83_01735 [Patescibacteria group bacterium]
MFQKLDENSRGGIIKIDTHNGGAIMSDESRAVIVIWIVVVIAYVLYLTGRWLLRPPNDSRAKPPETETKRGCE